MGSPYKVMNSVWIPYIHYSRHINYMMFPHVHYEIISEVDVNIMTFTHISIEISG